MKLEREREGVHFEICSVNDWIPFPSSYWGRREQMDTGRKGRRVWREGDGWGTDGVGGKRREESGRMVGKFSTWPWAEMKICIYLGASRSCFGMHTYVPLRNLHLKVMWSIPKDSLHCTLHFLEEANTTGGHLCCVQALLVMAEGWNESKHHSAQNGIGSGKSARHLSQPRNWNLEFWRGILRPVGC